MTAPTLLADLIRDRIQSAEACLSATIKAELSSLCADTGLRIDGLDVYTTTARIDGISMPVKVEVMIKAGI